MTSTIFSKISIKFFGCLPLRTLGCIYSSLMCSKSCGKVLFANSAFCILPPELFNRTVMSLVGSDDPMFHCSLDLTIVPLVTSEIISRSGMSTNCSLF